MRKKFRGIADEMIRLVEREQLKSRHLWELVTKQFAKAPDDADHGWRGEYWGKLMRGACMVWQYTEDEELYAVLEGAVKSLLALQDADGRIATYSKTEEFQGWDIWCRKYVLSGLLHFREICKTQKLKGQILEAAQRHTDYILAHIGEGRKKITRTSELWLGINSSSILEPVVWLYKETLKGRYLEFADYIVACGGAEGFDIFQAAYDDQIYPYQYPVVKAYELMSCFEGLLLYARAKGEERWKQAVIRFADRLLKSEATVVGGSGCHHELFNHSSLMQTGTKYDGLMLETCVTVTWMKLMDKLYGMTGDMRYLEEVERSAFNALYGAVNTENSVCGPETTFDAPYYREVYDCAVSQNSGKGQIFDSYSPLRAGIRGRAVGGFKSMEQEREYCGCCIAIGAAGVGLVPKAAVRETEGGVEFGIYLPGEISLLVGDTWVELLVDTDYPAGGDVSILVKSHQEKDFEVSLRIPSFVEHGKVWVNGEAQEEVQAGTFFRLKRNWKAGDCIRLSLAWNPRLVYGMENPKDSRSKEHVAVLYGPLVLARDRRIGEEGTPICVREGKVSVHKMESTSIPCQCYFEVDIDGALFPMIDYASAGKTWRRDSQMEVWMQKVNI